MSEKNPLKAVAFYLPQFHVIPENEAVYGPGFTEWNNVTAAHPLFEDHYQPHTPHKLLGYYDLTDEKALTLQHHMAYTNGVSAFCYYYYNLAGRPLLDAPLKIINQSPLIQNEFCLCWDHTSWYDNTRPVRDVPFIPQVYNKENARALLCDIAPYLANPRYIKIGGKPLLLIFAPERHPDIREYAAVWREEAARMGLGELYLAGVEAFAGCHPSVFGFDGMVEFAPNWHDEALVSAADEIPRRMDYIKTVSRMLLKEVPDYPRMRCVFPAWDNTPRRGERGMACVGTTPEAFRFMVEQAAVYTRKALPADMQYLFINAWNEWGEGCHLEPDEKYGFTHLNIVRDVIEENNRE